MESQSTSSNWPIVVSAAILLYIGMAHLVLTFVGNKLRPRDPEVIERMSNVPLGVSPATSTWRAWIGFNASHSLGLALFGAVYGFLALAHPSLFSSPFLAGLGAAYLGGMMVLARKYWFSAPFRVMLVALIVYLVGVVLAHD